MLFARILRTIRCCLGRHGEVLQAATELGFTPHRCYRWAWELAPNAGRGSKKTKYLQDAKDRFLAVQVRVRSVLGICNQWAIKAGIATIGPFAGQREHYFKLRTTGLSPRGRHVRLGRYTHGSKLEQQQSQDGKPATLPKWPSRRLQLRARATAFWKVIKTAPRTAWISLFRACRARVVDRISVRPAARSAGSSAFARAAMLLGALPVRI